MDALRFNFPITKFEKLKDGRLVVEGVATDETLDSQGDILDHEGSKRAFAKWNGNVREAHDPTKPVGRKLEVISDDMAKAHIVRAFVSAGAPDTQMKVEDGTLQMFSVGGSAPRKVSYEKTADGKRARRVEDWDMSELSLVDAGSNPNASFHLVKSFQPTEILADGTEPNRFAELIRKAVEMKSPGTPEPEIECACCDGGNCTGEDECCKECKCKEGKVMDIIDVSVEESESVKVAVAELKKAEEALALEKAKKGKKGDDAHDQDDTAGDDAAAEEGGKKPKPKPVGEKPEASKKKTKGGQEGGADEEGEQGEKGKKEACDKCNKVHKEGVADCDKIHLAEHRVHLAHKAVEEAKAKHKVAQAQHAVAEAEKVLDGVQDGTAGKGKEAAKKKKTKEAAKEAAAKATGSILRKHWTGHEEYDLEMGVQILIGLDALIDAEESEEEEGEEEGIELLEEAKKLVAEWLALEAAEVRGEEEEGEAGGKEVGGPQVAEAKHEKAAAARFAKALRSQIRKIAAGRLAAKDTGGLFKVEHGHQLADGIGQGIRKALDPIHKALGDLKTEIGEVKAARVAVDEKRLEKWEADLKKIADQPATILPARRQPAGPDGGSPENVVYNEIVRLEDILSKTTDQNVQLSLRREIAMKKQLAGIAA